MDAVTVDDIALAIKTNNTAPLLWSLAHATGLPAKKWAVAKLRPVLEPALQKDNLTWADVVPVLDAVSTEDIQSVRRSHV